MKTHIRKLEQKSLDIINREKDYPDEKIIEGYHIVGPNRSWFARKPLYVFLESAPGGGYNIRYGTWEIKKLLKGKLKHHYKYVLPGIVTRYGPPETQEELVKDALSDQDFRLGWKIIRKMWKEIKSRGN